MQKSFMEIAQRQGNPNTLTKDEFAEALEGVGIVESDSEILDRLFIMLDKTGDQQINFREFICGIAPLITGTVSEKLSFAFELYDMDGSGVVKKAEMNFILRAMNDTASYFGDPVMTQDQIAILVDEIYEKFGESRASSLSLTKQPADRRLHLPCAFSANCVPHAPIAVPDPRLDAPPHQRTDDEEGASGLNYKEFMDTVIQHPILVSFIKAEGPVRYGQSK
mmetsp:Transcript_17756/g.46473  ORF Transcript_17756/g.46473 Transcript_17756/m.46473 type:complete len:222 (-) Transcript_17756:111-776(-)